MQDSLSILKLLENLSKSKDYNQGTSANPIDIAKHRRADSLLQKLRSQVVVEGGAAGPAKMERILKLGDDLLNWSLFLQ